MKNEELMGMIIGDHGIPNKEYEKHIVLEIEVESDLFNYIVENKNEIEYTYIDEAANIARNLYLKYGSSKDTDISFYVRNKSIGGSRGGVDSNHAASVKIEAPFSGVTVKIPSKDDLKAAKTQNEKRELCELIYTNKDKAKVERNMDIINTVRDFIIDNYWELNNIFWTDKDYSAIKAYKRMIKNNPNMYVEKEASPKNSEDQIKDYQDEKRGYK